MEHGRRDGIDTSVRRIEKDGKDGGALDGMEGMRRSDSKRETDAVRVDDKQIAQPQVESEAMIRTTSRA
jgi:hypothetical protein